MNSPKPHNSNSLIERYRILGLAVEAAAYQDRWSEVSTLLDERDSILTQLQANPGLRYPQLEQAQACDKRLLGFMMGIKLQLGREMRQVHTAPEFRRAYKASGNQSQLDQAS
ncbi:MAG TPA: hypothetical protein VJ835_07985 [Fimbriimonadaceae bacterium]|nr:hypothetical protein [Fimbriimonadaceae bacterium]